MTNPTIPHKDYSYERRARNIVILGNFLTSSLRILATTSEPINKEASIWCFENVGKKRCPIINLSGGTEVGGAILRT
jgi:acetyl-CoA synthetase